MQVLTTARIAIIPQLRALFAEAEVTAAALEEYLKISDCI